MNYPATVVPDFDFDCACTRVSLRRCADERRKFVTLFARVGGPPARCSADNGAIDAGDTVTTTHRAGAHNRTPHSAAATHYLRMHARAEKCM